MTRATDGTVLAATSARRPRRWAMRVFAIAGLLVITFFFGVVLADATDLSSLRSVAGPDDPPASPAATAGAAAPDDVIHALAAATAITLAAAGLIGLILRPAAFGFTVHVLAAAATLLASGLIVGNPDNRGGQAGVLDPLTLILAMPLIAAAAASPSWRSLKRGGSPSMGRPSATSSAAVLLGAIGFTMVAVDQALMQRNTFPPAADPHHNAHWWAVSVAAALVAAVPAAGLLRHPGWRTGTFLSGLAALGVAAVSLLRPEAASALDPAPAAAAAIWGLALLRSVAASALKHPLPPRARATS